MPRQPPDQETIAGTWRLCRHLLGDDVAALAALAGGDDSVAAQLAACRAAVPATRPLHAPARQRRAVLALPPHEAEAVVLRHVEGLPLPAVAAALGLPRATAAARVRAA